MIVHQILVFSLGLLISCADSLPQTDISDSTILNPPDCDHDPNDLPMRKTMKNRDSQDNSIATAPQIQADSSETEFWNDATENQDSSVSSDTGYDLTKKLEVTPTDSNVETESFSEMIPSNPSPDEVLLADDGYMWHGKKSEMLKWCNNGRYLSCCYHIYKASLGYVTVDCDFYVEGTTCSYPEDLGWFCCKERSLNGRPHGPIIPDVGTCKEKARKRDPVVAPPRPTDLPERPEQKKDSPATCPQRQNNLP